MPTEFASAIADLRLSTDKLPIDAQLAQRELLRITERIEQNARVQLGVSIDVTQAQRDLTREVTRLTSAGAFNVPVGIDADDALDDLVALQDIVDPIALPVDADTDRALDDIFRLQDLLDVDPIRVPFEVDTSSALAGIDGVVNTALPETIESFDDAGMAAGDRFSARLLGGLRTSFATFGLAVGGFLSTALVTGFQRLTTIEDATASLTVALGSAAEAADTLDAVLGVVTGTPYNLDQFANAASNLISFGVEAEKVPLYLTAIGEAAANRGSRANEFAQRLSDTFGSISIQGRILGDDLLQLQGAGVDALSILGNSFGVAANEAQELLREGIIPVDDALDALSEGILNGTDGVNGATIAFAGTMEGLRDTLTGVIGGFRSSTARLGVAIIDPFQDALIAGFASATDVVNSFTSSIDGALAGLTDSEGFARFVDFIEEIPDRIDPLVESLSGLGPALAPLAAILGASGLSQLSNFLGPLGAVVPQIGAFTAAITAFIAFTPELREEALPVLAEFGETAALLAAGVGQTLGEGLEAITPLLGDFIEGLGNLNPLVRDLGAVTIALGQGFVPVLETFANILEGFPVDVLIAIGGAFVAFKGVDALKSSLGGVVERLDGVGRRLYLAEQDSQRYGTTFTAVASEAGLSSERLARASDRLVNGLNAASIAAAGFFSGLATQSDNAAIQLTGFAGSVTTIAASFRAGPIAGIATSAAVVGGALVGMWQDSKQAAEEYEAEIDDIAQNVVEDLGAATAALLDARELVREESFLDATIELIGPEEVRRLDELGVKLADITNVAADVNFSDTVRDQLDAAIVAAENYQRDQIQILNDQGILVDGEEAGRLYGRALEDGLHDVFDNVDGIDLSGLVDVLDDDSIDLTGLYQFLDTLDLVEDRAVDVGGRIGDLAEDERLRIEAILDTFQSQFALSDEAIDALTDAQEEAGISVDELIEKYPELAEAAAEFRRNLPDPSSVSSLDLIIRSLLGIESETKDAAEGFDGMTNAAEDMERAVTAATNRAARSVDQLNESLSEMLGTLDEITANQDYAAGFRDINAALNEVVNTDALRDAEKLIDDLGRQRDGIADLEAKIASEQADANILAADLDRRIAEAQAVGSVEGLAYLQAQRDAVFVDVNNLRNELDAEQAELAQIQAEFAAVDGQGPLTLGQLLENQARDSGLSFFNFLIKAPTPESLDFFQSQLAPQIERAGDQIQRAIDESPLLASIEIPSIVNALAEGLIQQGGGLLDRATVDNLVSTVFNPDLLVDEAIDAFEDQFSASIAELGGITEQILSGEGVDPSIDVNAIVESVGDDISYLQDLEEQGFSIPGDIDLEQAQTTLDAYQQAVEDNPDFAIYIPIEGDISGLVEDLESLQQYALSLATSGLTADQRLPPIPIDGITQFLHGGFHGTENHIAQLQRHGAIRVWGERETGGEAYIPMAQSKRPRSERILAQVAAEFGMAVTRIPTNAGLSRAELEDAVSRGTASGVGALREASENYDESVVMHNYFPDGTANSRETARDIRRRFVQGRRRPGRR